MKYFAAFLLLLLSLINTPLQALFKVVQKWYLPMWKKDKIIYVTFAPFYWILVGLTFIFGYPCEVLGKMVG